MPRARVIDSLAEIAPARWNALFRGELEDHAYLSAVEASGLEGFHWRYVLVEDGPALLAAAPVFMTGYGLETTLSGPGRRIAEAARRLFPNLLTLRLACIGSPCAETAGVGFHPASGDAERSLFLSQLIGAFEENAQRAGCRLLAIKDAPASMGTVFNAAAGANGYRPIAGQPMAYLDIDFADLPGYLARLSAATRKDLRRKLRTRDQVRIEVVTGVEPVLDDVMALYRQTRARAEMTFEELTPAYFSGVAKRMPERVLYVLYYEDDALLAVNLLLHDGATLLDKFFCMDAERGRALNLYFLSWVTNIGLCLERGIGRYVAGQASYDTKLRLGCALAGASNYFRHRNGLLNEGLRLVAPLFAADPIRKQAA